MRFSKVMITNVLPRFFYESAYICSYVPALTLQNLLGVLQGHGALYVHSPQAPQLKLQLQPSFPVPHH